MDPVLILVVIIILAVVIWWISTANNFKRTLLKVEEAKSGIEIALTKRYDVLTKMLDTARGYMKHEKETLFEVISMRRGMSVSELSDAESKMNELAAQIQVTAEAYPELRSSEIFTELQRSVLDVEEHLQAARRLYNANATRFNTMMVVFPSSLLAGGYTKQELFVAEEHKRADVKLEF